MAFSEPSSPIRPTTAHIIGGGLSGLCAALRLAERGIGVHIHEASPHWGGRCRSWHDTQLNAEIDNGNHLLLGANRRLLALVRTLGAEQRFHHLRPASFPFLDVQRLRRWQLRPRGLLSLFTGAALPPGATLPGFALAALRLSRASESATVADIFPVRDALYQRLIAPFCRSALNTQPEAASARLLANSFRALLTHRSSAEAWIPTLSWRDALIDPLLARLHELGVTLTTRRRLETLTITSGRATHLAFNDLSATLTPETSVILATPPWEARRLLPEVVPELSYSPIANLHFKPDEAFPVDAPRFIGLVNGAAEWVFRRENLASVTISAAHAFTHDSPEALAGRVWGEVCHALGHIAPLPAHRVIMETRATFAATPETLRLRPSSATPFSNLFLAGDYTATGLPACLEGAVISGESAAALCA
ncbi:MAG: FAD-dependent oxidoreductase [Alphaproteobacteria bacterium]|nr:FAD-dependent oxidoreductase [Alphaproteobacteria bacterium]